MTKPSERGRFANKAVEFAEVVMSRHLQGIADKVSNFDQEAASRAQAVASAQEALKLAETALEEGIAAAEAAQENLKEAETKQKEAETAVEAAPKLVAKSFAALDQETTSLKHAKDVLGTFTTMKDRSNVAPVAEKVVEEAIVAEATPAQEVADVQMDAIPAQ